MARIEAQMKINEEATSSTKCKVEELDQDLKKIRCQCFAEGELRPKGRGFDDVTSVKQACPSQTQKQHPVQHNQQKQAPAAAVLDHNAASQRQPMMHGASMPSVPSSHPQKADYVCELMTKHGVDILLIQEHWLFDGDIPSMARMIGDVNAYGVSEMPENKLVSGRRYGGWAVVVSSRLKCVTQPIVSANRRLFSFSITY
ncbi:hypothetical protein CAPTEDRAFT_198598 [Capitella teleta]|uniref:Endonuclease/exonuclease/phosphatase domain-containing protein n=1 Tax=Capitella teleta TaxID=283909 RepID=R7UYT4_CAPTE|nr:hypothetical protein CAPTEDRAFT_198598 [Capitella teleta]|eukprot:ELU11728.1 hypothetical protein CAPTEDRAFT_198598 [Capitella teleta]